MHDCFVKEEEAEEYKVYSSLIFVLFCIAWRNLLLLLLLLLMDHLFSFFISLFPTASCSRQRFTVINRSSIVASIVN